MSAVKAWHFTGATLRDGRPIPKVGEWLEHEGPVEMCESGLHASRRIFDALSYAPGCAMNRVECDDIVEEEKDKLVCRRRRILASLSQAEGEAILREFARWAALRVIHLWEAPDVVRRYLETGDESLGAAAFAASDAAWDAAGDAASHAALAASHAALAGSHAASAAALAASGAASHAALAARAAAEVEQNDWLERRVLEAMGLGGER